MPGANTANAAKHFVFDAYGTLFDVHSAARMLAPLIGEAWPRLSAVWRTKQLEYAFVHAGMGSHIPFRDCTQQGLVYALKTCELDEALAPRILAAYATLAVYEEVPDVLAALKATGAKLAILSNGDPDMIDDLVDHAHLREVFDALISVKVAGTFKPAPKVYALATEVFAVPAGEITFLSSNRWDIAGAHAFGFRTVWINRTDQPDEYPHLPPDRVVTSLKPLVHAA